MSTVDENNKNTPEPNEKLKKMKTRLEKLVMSMKKPDEDELDNSQEFEIKDIFASIKEMDAQTKAENVVTDTQLKEDKKPSVTEDTTKAADVGDNKTSFDDEKTVTDEKILNDARNNKYLCNFSNLLI